jgi:hypothetical protein
MMEFINEAYVKGIPDDVVADSKRLSRDEFYAACRREGPVLGVKQPRSPRARDAMPADNKQDRRFWKGDA